jgi:hypothetical protein
MHCHGYPGKDFSPKIRQWPIDKKMGIPGPWKCAIMPKPSWQREFLSKKG